MDGGATDEAKAAAPIRPKRVMVVEQVLLQKLIDTILSIVQAAASHRKMSQLAIGRLHILILHIPPQVCQKAGIKPCPIPLPVRMSKNARIKPRTALDLT